MLTADSQSARVTAPRTMAGVAPALRRWAGPLLAVGFALAVFARTLGFGLYLDDHHHVRPWGVAEVLGTFAGPFDPLGIEPVYYRPLTVATFALDWAIWGYNAWGYHLTNVLLHALATLLVYAVLRRVGAGRPASLLGALCFAAIPANAATAIYISERSDALATIFTLAAVLCVDAYRRAPAARWLVGLGALALLAFMSKEVGVALPLLAALAWVFFALPEPLIDEVGGLRAAPRRWARMARALLTRGQLRSAARVILPPLALLAGYLFFRTLVLPTGMLGARYSASASPLRGFASAVLWTFKAVPWEVAGLAAAPLAVGAALALLLRPSAPAWRIVLLGLAWVALACLPLSYLGQVEPRLLYLPEVGHAIVVCGLSGILGGAVRSLWATRSGARRAMAALVVLVALAWAGATGVSLARAQDEFRPGGPKMLGAMLEVYTNMQYRDRYPAYQLAQIERQLRAAGMIP